ncbi:MAG: UDP-N-acetylmuramate--L-alanine ligase [Anaerolineales bacterium]|jgi:UDP-N-acetylmuramate--alanine ligase
MVGIGGAGLSAIARVLHGRGEIVTGSDAHRSEYAAALENMGLKIEYQHRAENVEGADMVIASSAVPIENVELAAAEDAGIRIYRRKDFLGELTAGSQVVAVAGTHGKTTTTGMIAWILTVAGLDPSFVVGGPMRNLEGNGKAGEGPHFVIEADEYGLAFLGLQPSVAVVTNVEHDHPDFFHTFDEFQTAFRAFVERVQDLLIVCRDDSGSAGLERPGLSVQTYGLDPEAEWRAEGIHTNDIGGMDFRILHGGEKLGAVWSRLPGLDNVRNALAAAAAAMHLGVGFEEVRKALADYQGVERRFEVLGEAQGVTVVDDYAHHPTEIRSTLAAARLRYPKSRIWAVFQPHTFSRTRTLLPELKHAFSDADHVIMLEIFAAREEPDGSIDGSRTALAVDHKDVRFIAKLEEAAGFLLEHVAAPAVVITLSAGDGNLVGQRLLQGIRDGAGGNNDEG